MPLHKTSAGPLALAYAALVAYASLYPFEGWRLQGLAPWAFMASPWPRWWTGFDIAANVLGYAPLGFLVALTRLRRDPVAGGPSGAVLLALGVSAVWAFVMEALQTFLPTRVPSNLDLGLNVAGALLGAVLAVALEWLGLLRRWSRFRRQWLVSEARGALVLLTLWPVALLFPPPLPLGLGQVLHRAAETLADWLEGTPMADWLPVADLAAWTGPMRPATEMVGVALGLLVPVLLAFSVMGSPRGRLGVTLGLLLVGMGCSALSAALSYGPVHAWAWLSAAVQLGLVVALALSLMMAPLPRRACVALLLPALVLHLSLVQQVPTSAYYSLTLQAWEQGRFIRFHGLAQWVGWVWPYVVLAYALLRVSRADSRT
jgi:VanZ family protein